IEGSSKSHSAAKHQFHHLLASSHHAQRESPSDGLPKGGQVRSDTIMLLGSPQGQAKTGDDFIKDQECAVLLTKILEAMQVPWQRQQAAAIAEHRFQNNRGNGRTFSLQRLLCEIDSIPRHDTHVLRSIPDLPLGTQNRVWGSEGACFLRCRLVAQKG